MTPVRPASASDISNPLDAFLGYQLRRASAVVFAHLGHALEDLTLKPTDASVLMLIAAHPGITQSEIGRTLAIKRANMAPIAALLTGRGLIERVWSDGRSQGLALTPEGTALAATVRQRIEHHEAQFLVDLSATDRAALVAMVRRIWSDARASGRGAGAIDRPRRSREE